MSKTLASDWAVVEGAVETAWQDCLAAEGEGYVALRTEVLLRQQPSLQSNLVRRAAGRIDPGLRDFGMQKVERALAFAQSPPRSQQLALTGKIQVRLDGERFYLLLAGTRLPGEAWPQIPVGYCARLPIPGEMQLPGDWLLQVRMELPSELSSNSLDGLGTRADQDLLPAQRRFEAWLDANSLVSPLELRQHRAGERWQPLGMRKGSIKLSDFFTNVKLPRTARAGWPVLFSGNNIAWLPGFRPGEAYRVHANTTRVAHILLVKEGYL
jgi:tRNA(Ile)-lysidine synthase